MCQVYTNGPDHVILGNSKLQLTILQGRITSLYDVKLKRELVPKGSTGGLVIFEDRPHFWDAWGALRNPTSLYTLPEFFSCPKMLRFTTSKHRRPYSFLMSVLSPEDPSEPLCKHRSSTERVRSTSPLVFHASHLRPSQ